MTASQTLTCPGASSSTRPGPTRDSGPALARAAGRATRLAALRGSASRACRPRTTRDAPAAVDGQRARLHVRLALGELDHAEAARAIDARDEAARRCVIPTDVVPSRSGPRTPPPTIASPDASAASAVTRTSGRRGLLSSLYRLPVVVVVDLPHRRPRPPARAVADRGPLSALGSRLASPPNRLRRAGAPAPPMMRGRGRALPLRRRARDTCATACPRGPLTPAPDPRLGQPSLGCP